MTNPYAPPHQQQPRGKGPLIWSWVSVAFGIFCVLSLSNVHGLGGLIGNTLFGIGIAVPGAWWLWNNHQYDKALESYKQQSASNAYLSNLLQDSDPHIVAGMGTLQPPERPNMRWPLVTIVALALVFIGSGMS